MEEKGRKESGSTEITPGVSGPEDIAVSGLESAVVFRVDEIDMSAPDGDFLRSLSERFDARTLPGSRIAFRLNEISLGLRKQEIDAVSDKVLARSGPRRSIAIVSIDDEFEMPASHPDFLMMLAGMMNMATVAELKVASRLQSIAEVFKRYAYSAVGQDVDRMYQLAMVEGTPFDFGGFCFTEREDTNGRGMMVGLSVGNRLACAFYPCEGIPDRETASRKILESFDEQLRGALKISRPIAPLSDVMPTDSIWKTLYECLQFGISKARREQLNILAAGVIMGVNITSEIAFDAALRCVDTFSEDELKRRLGVTPQPTTSGDSVVSDLNKLVGDANVESGAVNLRGGRVNETAIVNRVFERNPTNDYLAENDVQYIEILTRGFVKFSFESISALGDRPIRDGIAECIGLDTIEQEGRNAIDDLFRHEKWSLSQLKRALDTMVAVEYSPIRFSYGGYKFSKTTMNGEPVVCLLVHDLGWYARCHEYGNKMDGCRDAARFIIKNFGVEIGKKIAAVKTGEKNER